MNQKKFSTTLLAWYHENARPLPWRQTNNPYKIWISEVILQQTRVAQGLPYYKKFVKKFPTVYDLAKATEQEVLHLWQGLGYYTRARNLHRCAQEVVEKYQGRFPVTFKELIKLPGIGSYTAAAIASLAFREVVAVVDGNVFRVLARFFGIDKDIASHEGKEYFFWLANKLISPTEPDIFNQALMEFGALHCLPQNPKCNACVFSSSCVAYQKSTQAELPVKRKKQKSKTRYFYYFIIKHKNKVLMRSRKEKDIWRGLYDFYLIETTRPANPMSLIKNDTLLKKLTLLQAGKGAEQVLSHQKLKVRFIEMQPSFPLKINSDLKKNGLRWFTINETKSLPKPVLINRYLSKNP
ncbi:MAG: A/G-specific adenine glycosylase [Bacteroidetes bacterium]|nr:A/G-specific adenine glycosylase [Bacteroidota bacterium]